jgi:DhnA family fructose-bisphosphate aldolase class Ia
MWFNETDNEYFVGKCADFTSTLGDVVESIIETGYNVLITHDGTVVYATPAVENNSDRPFRLVVRRNDNTSYTYDEAVDIVADVMSEYCSDTVVSAIDRHNAMTGHGFRAAYSIQQIAEIIRTLKASDRPT